MLQQYWIHICLLKKEGIELFFYRVKKNYISKHFWKEKQILMGIIIIYLV